MDNDLIDMYTTSCLNETMVAGIFFDPIFQNLRERQKGNWTIPIEAKENLEQSIRNSGKGEMATVNSPEGEI